MLQPALRRRLGSTATGALRRSAHSQVSCSSTSSVLAGPKGRAAGTGGIRARPWEALQRRGLAVETSEPTPVPPPPPAPRNYVYPAVLALTAAAVVFVMMTPDDENIDAKIMEAVKARMPAGAEDGEQEAVAAGAQGKK